MDDPEKGLQAIKLKGHVGPDRKLEIMEDIIELPEGDVEVILLYQQRSSDGKTRIFSPLTWPTLDGGRYLGGTLRREDIYGNDKS